MVKSKEARVKVRVRDGHEQKGEVCHQQEKCGNPRFSERRSLPRLASFVCLYSLDGRRSDPSAREIERADPDQLPVSG
jgi:hypothetical protein